MQRETVASVIAGTGQDGRVILPFCGLKDAQGSPAHQFQARNQVSDGVSIALAHIFNRYTIDHIILHWYSEER